MGIKHQGLATAFVGIPVVVVGSAYSDRRIVPVLRKVCLYGGVALAVVAPWYLRSYALAGNPVWPLANGFFHGQPFGVVPGIGDAAGEASGILRPTEIQFLEWLSIRWKSMSPWAWAFDVGTLGWQKATGIYFVALAPAVALFLGNRRVAFAAGFCVLYYVILVRFLHMNPRYGLVLFVAASIVCGYAAGRLNASVLRPARFAFRAVFVATMLLNIGWAFQLARPVIDVAVGSESRERFLRRTEPNYQVLEYASRNLPEGSGVLLQGMVKGFYCDRAYVWDHPFQSAIIYGEMKTPEDLLARLRELGISHVARMIRIPGSRLALGYPQYFLDEFHEAFRRRYLRLVHRDNTCVLFEVTYEAGPSTGVGQREG